MHSGVKVVTFAHKIKKKHKRKIKKETCFISMDIHFNYVYLKTLDIQKQKLPMARESGSR